MDIEHTAMFVGSKRIGMKALSTLLEQTPAAVKAVVTIDDSDDERSILCEFRAFCDRHHLPLSVLRKPSELGAVVEANRPFFVLVVGWYWIVPPNVRALVPGGFVGVHSSLLPAFRGSAPLVWAILTGQSQTGITMFYFDDGMDTGDIVDQRTIPISHDDTIAAVLSAAEGKTIELVAAHARGLLAGTVPCREQDERGATYGSLRRPEDGRIDWKLSAREIHDFIRAQTRPYPGAFTYLPDGRELRIWKASVFPYPYHGIAGVVAQTLPQGVVVLCGQGAIVVEQSNTPGAMGEGPSPLKWAMRLG